MTGRGDPRKAALEAFVVGNHDLEQLEALLSQFNVFEAIGATRNELRHSDFLAFLLNPRENHGLADAFLKRLLQRAVVAAGNQDLAVSGIDLDVWDLDDVEIRREWQNLDILILDDAHKLVVVIENKIGTTEHDDQLARYRDLVARTYPKHAFLGLYLTPEGDVPTDEAYLAVSYKLVRDVVEELAKNRASTLGPDVRVLMTHYAAMLGRHVVMDSEIAELARRIYDKHKDAIDIIIEHRPDKQAEVRAALEEVTAADPHVIPEHSVKAYIRLVPKEWDVPALRQGVGWLPSGRMLIVEFWNYPGYYLKLKVMMGPGPEDVRQAIFDLARSETPTFKPAYRKLNKKWDPLWERPILSAKQYDELDVDEIKTAAAEALQEFREKQLPAMTAALRKLPFFNA